MSSTVEPSLQKGSSLGGVLLVTGTAIGAGMLGLPVLTSLGGFAPTAVIYVIAWVLMAVTGLLFLEIALWMERGANIVSMAARTLGRGGQVFAWIVYLYLFYSLVVAYVTGGGIILRDITDGAVSAPLGSFLFALVFAPWVYVGAKAVDTTNFMMVVGLAVTYAAFAVLGTPHVDPHLLARHNWFYALAGLPVIITSFGYQGIVPSLTSYLQRNVKKLRVAILVGSFLPLLAYIVWQFLILGIVPLEGVNGLLAALEQGNTAVHPLRYVLDSAWVYAIGQFFAFFALTSSFLGVGLGLRDFLMDGFRARKSKRNYAMVCLLIFVPALIISWSSPRLFLLALRYGGGIGVTLLLGLLPVVMVWRGRYHLKLQGPYQVRGGKAVLVLIALGFLATLVAAFVEIT